jgi:hypothetical protein
MTALMTEAMMNTVQNHLTIKPVIASFVCSGAFFAPITENTPVWEAQLKKLSENDTLISKQGLEFVDYKYVGHINNLPELEEVKLYMIDNFTLFPSNINPSDGIYISERISKSEFRELLNLILPSSENDKSGLSDATYVFQENDMGKVLLRWKYRGKEITTLCLVSEKKGIIYDNFLYFISFPFESIKISQRRRLRTSGVEGEPVGRKVSGRQ